MAPRGRLFSVVAVVAGALWAGSTRAATKLQGTLQGWIGYTDNAQSAPDDAVTGSRKAPGAFVLASPGVLLAAAGPRAIHRLSYTYSYDFFLSETKASVSTNRVEYRGFFDLSPRTALVTDTSVIESSGYAGVLFAPPSAGTLTPLPSGVSTFLGASTDAVLSEDVSPEWRAWQGAGVVAQTPIFDTVGPTTTAPAVRAGVERVFQFDAAGVEARGEYSVVTNGIGAGGARLDTQKQLVETGAATYRHDWTRDITSRVEAGVSRVDRLGAGRGFWHPAGGATLAYANGPSEGQLTYAHTLQVNPLLGQTLLVDEVRARAALALAPKDTWVLSASAWYQAGRILDEDANPAAHLRVLLADAALGYRATDSLVLAVRYQLVDQSSDTEAPGLPRSFLRNMVMIGATLKLPADKDMPLSYRAPLRVDRGDEIRDAVEPDEGGARDRNPRVR